MLGQMQYKILLALKDGAVSNLGVFYKVCKLIIEEDGEFERPQSKHESVMAAKTYIRTQDTKNTKEVKRLYDICNRSLQTLIRTSVVKRSSSATLEPRSDGRGMCKCCRTNLQINEDLHEEVRIMMMERRLRNNLKR